MITFKDVNYVLMSEGDQGVKWTTRDNLKINQFILDRPGIFKILRALALPSGDFIRIYYISR